MCVDFALIYWRVRNGIYGDNRLEAEELLTFMTRRDNDPELTTAGRSRSS